MKMRSLIEAYESSRAFGSLEESSRREFRREVADIGFNWTRNVDFEGKYLEAFHPLSNIGQRRKKVTISHYYVNGCEASGDKWIRNLLKNLKGKSRVSVDQLDAEVRREVDRCGGEVIEVPRDVVSGTHEDLPLPKSYSVDSISGADIVVDMNSNPISVGSASLESKLGGMRYVWTIPMRYRDKLLSLRGEIEKVRNSTEMKSLLRKHRIKFEYFTTMGGNID